MSKQIEVSDKAYDLIKGLQVHFNDAKRSLTWAAMNIADLPKEENECFLKTETAIKEMIGDLEVSRAILDKYLS